jgi:hypothetical protein
LPLLGSVPSLQRMPTQERNPRGGKKGPMVKTEDVEFSNKAVSDENSVKE